MWETDSKGTRHSPDVVVKTVTPDFELYDAGIVPANPDAAFLYKDRKAMADDFADASKWVSETDEKYNLIFSFASCDMVGVRWEMHGKSGKHENTTVHVPVGSPVEYKGIDILQVDLNTRMIRKAVSSADYLNYYAALGMDVLAPALKVKTC
ncbi:hypothetical protein HII31_01809 [Pseudocercospora fuligena]|uniref:NTF2-like domain-containing protein n=1 Tax=Pseudocercospora fuligena TaxID=685502 RepID=A0A8H6RR34_9PEZI|nr:hypothetical protein HII31_01809 [Pseudocercospora fuligena]